MTEPVQPSGKTPEQEKAVDMLIKRWEEYYKAYTSPYYTVTVKPDAMLGLRQCIDELRELKAGLRVAASSKEAKADNFRNVGWPTVEKMAKCQHGHTERFATDQLGMTEPEEHCLDCGLRFQPKQILLALASEAFNISANLMQAEFNAKEKLRIAEAKPSPATKESASMNLSTESNEPPTCMKCGDEFTVPDGYEVTDYCDPCAQELVPELLQALDEIATSAHNGNEPGQTWIMVAGGLIDSADAAIRKAKGNL